MGKLLVPLVEYGELDLARLGGSQGRLLHERVRKVASGGHNRRCNPFFIKDRYDRHQSRRTLLRALHTEARTTWQAIHDLLERFPTRAQADAIVDGVKAKTLTFEVLDELPAGWTLFIPSFPLADTISKLKPREAEAAIASSMHRPG